MRKDFQDALNFAREAENATDFQALEARFSEVTRPFGVEYYAADVAAAPGQALRPRFLFGRVNSDWTRHYLRAGYAPVDPCVAMLFETLKPFTWQEAYARRPTAAGRRILDEVREIAGVDKGLVVPIHDRDGETGAVVLSGADLDVSPEVRPVLHLLAVYFNGVGRDLVELPMRDDDCPLTDRQRECLRWVMDGKSDWEIGEILSISEHTVHKHIEAGKRALDVGTRTQAVIQSWRRGWLV